MSPRIPIRLLAVQSDERLARLVREGHERAFEALVNRHRRPLLRYCQRMGLSDSRAEDAVQLALLNAWQALARGTEVRELSPWLYRVAHNAAISSTRGSAERDADLASVSGGAPCYAAEDRLERRLAVSDALAEVAALPAMQRQAMLLTAIEGKTHDEVAGALGIKQDAVRGLLYRARATLRNAAALIPQPLIGWASGGSGAASTASGRLSEAAAAGGTGGALAAGSALLKGAVVAITAGALVGATAIAPRGHRGRARAPAVALAQVSASSGPDESNAAPLGTPSASNAPAPHGAQSVSAHRVARTDARMPSTTVSTGRTHSTSGGLDLPAMSRHGLEPQRGAGDVRAGSRDPQELGAEAVAPTPDTSGAVSQPDGGERGMPGERSGGGGAGDQPESTPLTPQHGGGSDDGGAPSYGSKPGATEPPASETQPAAPTGSAGGAAAKQSRD